MVKLESLGEILPPQYEVTKAASFPFVPMTYSSTFLRAAVQLKQQSSTKGLWHELLELDDPCTCCPGQDKLHLNGSSPSHEQWLWTCARWSQRNWSWLLAMNCYSALTKEEALTTPPVTLAKGFVKQVCASLPFQPAGIDCSLLHGNVCSGRAGRWRQLGHHAGLCSREPWASWACPEPASGALLAPCWITVLQSLRGRDL